MDEINIITEFQILDGDYQTPRIQKTKIRKDPETLKKVSRINMHKLTLTEYHRSLNEMNLENHEQLL